jgi:tetratricopeptide (TPR) repeat protein
MLALGLINLSRSSWAQPDPTEAELLFREGRQLLKDGQLEQACTKLAESQRLDPSSGTLMNLGHCHQEQGKYASAHAEFSAAASLAAAQGRAEREAEARARADALLPRLSYLVLRIIDPVPQLEIARNGTRLEPSALDHPIAVDRGTHEIRATAPEHTEWSLTLTVTQPGRHVIDIPQLALRGAPASPKASPSAPQASRADRSSRSLESRNIDSDQAEGRLPASFWVATGSTVLAAGVGTAAGVMSLLSYNEAKDLCEPPYNACPPAAMTSRENAGTQATIANVAVGTAVVAAGVSVYLFVTSRGARRDRRSAALRLSAQPTLSWDW